jgi:hypothetical protein
MALGFPGPRPDGSGRSPRVQPVMCEHCEHCGTHRHLTIRSMTDLQDYPAGVVLVSYTCGRRRRFSEHPARVADVSMVLASTEQTDDVLIFGGHYMHCGQPMGKAGSELRRLSAPLSADGTGEVVLDVYLSTRVLRCVCGFQIELPE